MPPADTGLEQQYQDAISNPVPSMVSMPVAGGQQRPRLLPFGYNKVALRFSLAAGALILIIGGATLTANLLHGSSNKNNSGSPKYPVSSIQLQGIKDFNLAQASQLAVNGQIQANDSIVLAPTSQPSAPVSGQIYYDKTTNSPYFYNGTQFVNMGAASPTSLDGATGAISLGSGLTLVDNKLSVSSSVLNQGGGGGTTTNVTNVTNAIGVSSLQGLTGDLSLAAGTGIGISGMTISNNGVVGLSSSNSSVNISSLGGGNFNLTVAGGPTGVTSLDSQTGALSLANSSASGSTITINDASTAQKGIASFNNANFAVVGGAVSLATTGVSANTYGDAADVATFTVNAFGQLTAAGTSAISIAGNQVSSGTVADARLSGNVAKYNDTTANFTGTLQQNSNNVCTTAGNCTVGNGVGPGGAFTQGGDAFGATGVLGTTDNFGLNIETHGATALSIDTAKNLVAANNLTVQGNTATVGVVGTTAGQLVLASATAGGSITLKTAAGQATAFSVSFPAIASADTICLATLNNCSGVNGGSGDPNYIFNQNTQQTNANFDIQARSATVAAVIQGAAGQDITDFVNSSGQTVAKFDNNAQLTLGIAGTLAGKLALGGAGAGGSFSLQADPLQTSSTALTLPADVNANDILCLKNLNNCAGSGVGGTGTANQVAYFTNANTISSSSLFTIAPASQQVTVNGNGTSLTGFGLKTGSATVSGGISLGRTSLVTSDGSLGVVGVASDWSGVAVPGDIVLRDVTNNLILGVSNGSGNILFATGPISSETTKLTVTNAGNLTFSQASTISTNTGQLTINAGGANSLLLQTNGSTAMTIDSSGNTTFAANKNLNTSGSGTVTHAQTSTATSGVNIGTNASFTASPASAPAATTYYLGIMGQSTTSTSNVANVVIQGVSGYATYSGSSTLSQTMGVIGQSANLGTGTITDDYNIYANHAVVSSGAITNSYGLYVVAQKVAGVSNGYGVYQAGSADQNILLGNTSIGSATTTNLFNVGSSAQFQINSSGTVVAGTWNGAVLGAQYGGTGQNSYTVGDMLYASGASSLTKLADVATGSCLTSGGVGAAPVWGSCSGGAGSTLQADYTASTGGTTPEVVEDSTRTTVDIQAYSGQAADLLDLRGFASVGLGTIEFGVTPAGNATVAGSLSVGGQSVFSSSGILQSAALAGTYSSVLTFGSSSNSYAGTWNGNTIAVNKGGTGLSSYTSGDLLYANGAASLTTVHISGTSGECLNSNGANPFWGACGSGSGIGGSGTSGQVAYFNGSSSLTSSSSLTFNGSTLSTSFVSASSYSGGSFSGSSVSASGNVGGGSLTSSGSISGGSATVSGNFYSSSWQSGVMLQSSSGQILSLIINSANQTQVNSPTGVVFSTTGFNVGRISNAGNLTISGTLTQNGSPDYDETIYASDNSAAGDVVMADPNNDERIVKANGAYNAAAVGIVTDGSGSVIDSPEYYNRAPADVQQDGLKGVPVALAGRVPVHVTNENGAIMPGDHLTTSSIPGYAMKATQPGPTIGIAYGSFNSSTGTVLALVNVGYYDPTAGQNIQADNATLNTLTVNSAMQATDINVGNMATLKALDVTANANIGGDLNVGGNLSVTGLTTVQDISIDGHILSHGPTPAIVAGEAAGQVGQASIDGTDTAGTLTITVGAGAGETLASGVLANITFAKAYTSTPRIVLNADNPASPGLPVYLVKTNTGYQVMLTQAAQSGQTYQFDYVVVGSSSSIQ